MKGVVRENDPRKIEMKSLISWERHEIIKEQ